MDLFANLLSLFLHLDQHLTDLASQYGNWLYGILFLIVFCETGLVITPFLPGDSLLFAAGALAATVGSLSIDVSLNIHVLFLLLTFAAILGDTVNYAAGHYFGEKVFSPDARVLKQEYLDRTHAFFERHGGKTIVIARFVPIIRTFAPFVAGAGSMSYRHFLLYNVVGGIAWTSSFLYGGYFFGNLPFVKNNFTLVILMIIILSIMPGVVEYWRQRRAPSAP
ncbi:MAG TPA: DedA family protein [Candidatus Competibacteraceae bacterium]|nr:MAG: DedA family protein [Candidatus Competibacteraceae bacterium]HNW79506.1 DedA family protein [Candidatus Competibacteraceae bacterium]HQC73027.1 DedA family protein [Candidatus Competibacteraceae bacterium]